VAVVRQDNVAAIVELRCETDFVAKSAEFVSLADELAALVASKGEEAPAELQDDVDRLSTTLKENISVGRVVAHRGGRQTRSSTPTCTSRPAAGQRVAIELEAHPELAHDLAVHIAFARPSYLHRDDVPADEVAAERETIEAISKNEGKPRRHCPRSSRVA